MTLKQFMKKIGGMTNKEYIVELNVGIKNVQIVNLGTMKALTEYIEYEYNNNTMNYNELKEMMCVLIDKNLLANGDCIIDNYTEENEYGKHNILIVKDRYNVFWKYEIAKDTIYRWELNATHFKSFERGTDYEI